MSERDVGFHASAVGLSGSDHEINASVTVHKGKSHNVRQASVAQVAPYLQWNQFTLTFAFTKSLTVRQRPEETSKR